MANSTINQRLSIEGVQGIIAQLRDMGAAGEAAIRRINNAAGTGSLDHFTATVIRAGNSIQRQKQVINEFEGAIGPALSRLNRFSQAFGELRGVMGALAPAMKEFAEIGIGAGFLVAVRSAAVATRELVNRAAELGTTTEKLEGFGYAAAGVGLSIEDSNRALSRLAARVGEAQRNATQTADTLALKAREYSLEQDKQAQSIVKAQNELAKLRREQAGASLATERFATGVDRTNLALDKQSIATYKAKNAADALAASGGNRTKLQNLEAQDVVLKNRIEVANEVEAQENKVNIAREASISIGERIRDAENKIRIAREEGDLTLEKARMATENNKDEIIRLGVAIFDSGGKGRDFIDIAGDISDKLKGMATAQERAAVMLKIFGRGWSELAPVMELGSRGIYEQTEAFKAMMLTQDETAKGLEFSGAWSKLLYNLSAVKNILGDIISTAFTPWLDAVRELLMNNITTIREFGQAIADVAGFVGGQFLAAFKDVGSQIAVVLGVIKRDFDAVAADINSWFGTNLTGADIIVSLIAVRLAITRLIPLFSWLAGAQIAKIATVFLSTAQAVIAFGKSLATLEFTAMFAAIGPAGWIIVGIIAMGAWLLTATGKWKEFFDNINTGFKNTIALAQATWNLLKAVAEASGLVSRSAPSAPQGSQAGPSATQDADNARAEAENRQLYAGAAGAYPGKAAGGWIPGSGRGDKVPILAEPGEFMVKRSVAERVGGFLSALNAGLVGGFSMGGIVDSLNSVAPMTAGGGALPAAKPADDRALFHLTIGDKTFSNLSAPRRTAEEMLEHARTSSMVSMGKRQGFVGSG